MKAKIIALILVWVLAILIIAAGPVVAETEGNNDSMEGYRIQRAYRTGGSR